MANREMKRAIGLGIGELQTLFQLNVNATKQAAEETRKELTPMNKTLTDIDGALATQREHFARQPQSKPVDNTFGQLWMRNKAVRLDTKGKILTVDDTVFNLTPGLLELITNKHSRPDLYNNNDKGVYRSLVAQTRVRSFPNMTFGARPHATWKWKQLLKKMVIPGEMIEESGDTDDADSAESQRNCIY